MTASAPGRGLRAVAVALVALLALVLGLRRQRRCQGDAGGAALPTPQPSIPGRGRGRRRRVLAAPPWDAVGYPAGSRPSRRTGRPSRASFVERARAPSSRSASPDPTGATWSSTSCPTRHRPRRGGQELAQLPGSGFGQTNFPWTPSSLSPRWAARSSSRGGRPIALDDRPRRRPSTAIARGPAVPVIK